MQFLGPKGQKFWTEIREEKIYGEKLPTSKIKPSYQKFVTETTALSVKTGSSMMIILHGDTIEQLAFILSEFRAALAVTNPGRGSRQPHTEQL